MVTVAQGEIWSADLGDPRGSAPGFRRPVVVIQGDQLNRSTLATVVCVAITSNLRWGAAPGNVLLPAESTGLPRDSIANVTQIISLDRGTLTERTGKLPKNKLQLVLAGVDLVLGR